MTELNYMINECFNHATPLEFDNTLYNLTTLDSLLDNTADYTSFIEFQYWADY